MRTSELQGSSLLFLYRFERACQKCDIYLGNPPHFCLSLLLYECTRLLVQYCLSQTFLKIAVQCFLSSWSNIERKCSRPGWIVHTLYCVHFRLSSKELGLTKLNVVYVSAWVKGSLNVLLSMRLLLLQIWQTYLNGHDVTILDLGLDVLWGAKGDTGSGAFGKQLWDASLNY